MEKAVDQLTSEKRTAEERRREVETQLVQMVKKSSTHTAVAVDDTTSTTEASSGADELLDPQLCRRLQQLLDKLHTQGLQVRWRSETKSSARKLYQLKRPHTSSNMCFHTEII